MVCVLLNNVTHTIIIDMIHDSMYKNSNKHFYYNQWYLNVQL